MLADLPDSRRVDLWKIALTDPVPSLEYLSGLLSADETNRANRFVFERDRNKFIRTRGLLRIILGRYLEIGPELIEFRYEPGGKPRVADALNPFRLRFNVSHSAEIALIAVGFGRELGIDVEYIRPNVDVLEIATHFFSPREILELSGLPGNQQIHGFFNCWTRKEAFVKAIGLGLSFPLTAFDVSVRPGEPATLTRLEPNLCEQTQWILWDVSPSDDYAAALAVDGALEISVVWRSRDENSESGIL